MWRKNRWLLLMAVASACVGFLLLRSRAASPGRGQTLPAASPFMDRFAVEEGGRLYTRYCQPCHGESGQGDGRFYASSLQPAPADFTAPAFRSSHTDQRLREAITGGSASVGKSDLCPAWGKTFLVTEVDYLVAHIRKLQEAQKDARGDALP